MTHLRLIKYMLTVADSSHKLEAGMGTNFDSCEKLYQNLWRELLCKLLETYLYFPIW